MQTWAFWGIVLLKKNWTVLTVLRLLDVSDIVGYTASLWLLMDLCLFFIDWEESTLDKRASQFWEIWVKMFPNLIKASKQDIFFLQYSTVCPLCYIAVVITKANITD